MPVDIGGWASLVSAVLDLANAFASAKRKRSGRTLDPAQLVTLHEQLLQLRDAAKALGETIGEPVLSSGLPPAPSPPIVVWIDSLSRVLNSMSQIDWAIIRVYAPNVADQLQRYLLAYDIDPVAGFAALDGLSEQPDLKDLSKRILRLKSMDDGCLDKSKVMALANAAERSARGLQKFLTEHWTITRFGG